MLWFFEVKRKKNIYIYIYMLYIFVTIYIVSYHVYNVARISGHDFFEYVSEMI